MNPETEEKSGQAKSVEIFKNRAGTTDIGKDYKHFLIADIILKLVKDDNVEDCLLSSNDEGFGSFADVVIEIKYRNSKNIVTYAIQLKHKDKGKLTIEQLADEKDECSIYKYFKDYLTTNNLKRESVNLILFTNCELSEKSHFSLTLDNEVCDVEVLTNHSDELISTTEEGYCFTFKSDKERNGFFQNFFLYTSQLNVKSLRKSCSDKFITTFSCLKSIFNDYLNFVIAWSLIKSKKKKLNKDWMRRMILVRVLSPFIQTLSFKGKPLNRKIEILHKAVSTFQITLLHQKDSYEQLKKNWENATIDVDIKQFNETNKKYQVTLDYFEQIDESVKEDVDVNKILWLMKKCPLVIEADENKPGVRRTLDLLLRDEKLVILSQNFNIKSLRCLRNKQKACFKCLSDLRGAKKIYDEVLDRFVVSIEGQQEAKLKEIIAIARNVESDFKTDTLVKLVNDPLLVGRSDDSAIPPHYVTRTLSQIIIDSKYLINSYKDDLIIVTNVTEMMTFKKWCQTKKIYAIDFSVKTEPTAKAIYVTEKNCSQQQFDDLCKTHKKSNYHQFKYISCDQLEWKRSKNGVSKLRLYQLEDNYGIQESKLFNYSNNNLINIICEKPGMGKTTLMKSLKRATPSTCWTIFIFAKNCVQHLKKYQDDVNKFLEFIVEDSCKGYSNLDKIILNNFLKNGKIQIVWDGLDEVLSQSLEIVTKMINKINNIGLKQWLTSWVYLTDKLEQQFNVFSRTIKEFNETEQMNYIKNRLSCSDEELPDIFSIIKHNIDLLTDNSILGIPLQVFMLTELLIEDTSKYLQLLDNLFTIADLYKHFVEKKICDHYKKKRKYNLDIDENRNIINKINEYKKIAVPQYIEVDLKIANECQNLLLKIKSNKDPRGFIIKVTEDMILQFSHNSYGEYFAALYLSENYEIAKQIKDFYLNDNYVNIRFFLDLILAKDCKAHIAVLYRNSKLLDDCTENEINLKDKVGRTCLELSCKWFKECQFLETFKSTDCYIIKTSKVDDERLEEFSTLVEKKFSTLLNRFNLATLPLKKLILLFPFVLLFVDENYQICDIAIPSLLYYAIKFNYKIVLKFFKDLPCTLVYDDIINKTLLHHAVKFKKINFIKTFLSNEKYKDMVNEDLEIWYKICALKSTDLLEELKNYGCDLNTRYNYYKGYWTVAHYVCSETDDSSTLKFLIKNGADINLTDSKGYTPANYICQFKSFDMIKVMLNHIDLTSTNESRNFAIHFACRNRLRGEDIVKCLVEYGYSVNVCDIDGNMPIHIACKNEECGRNIVRFLTKCGSSVNKRGKNDSMPIHIACENEVCGTDIVKHLIRCGSNVNDRDKNGNMPIHIACKNAKSGRDMVRYLVKCGSSVNNCNKNGNMPIHTACENQRCGEDIAEYLLKCGSTVNVCDKNGNMPIHIACQNEWHGEKIVKDLVENGSSVNHCNENGNMPIHIACQNKWHGENIVKDLIENGSSVNDCDENGNMPIHIACQNEWHGENIVKDLVESGSSVNDCNENGNLPVHIACENKRLGKRIVKYLVECGSSVNDCNKNGSMPIHIACENKVCGKDIVKYLEECGSKVDVCDKNGNMPIHIACGNTGRFGNDIVKYLAQCGCSIDDCDQNGNIPIHIACKNERFGYVIVKYLEQCGSSVNDCNKDKSMPIHIASKNASCGNEIVKYLVKHGSIINASDKDGYMPIHIACINEVCGKSIVKYLVECGSDVNVCDENGNIPIHIACQNEWHGENIVKYLVECGSTVNVGNKDGHLPIHTACINELCGKTIVKYLVECGSGVNVCDKNGNMPIHIACENKWCGKNLVKYLVECGSHVNVCNDDGNYPIHIACINKKCGKEIIKYLVQCGSTVNVCNKIGKMPIHIACENERGGKDIVKYLLECGFSVNDCDKNRNLPIHIACANEGCGKNIVKYLVDCGSHVNVCNDDGNYPIHIACMNCENGYDIVKLLIEKGASTNVINKEGLNPVDLVVHSNEELMYLLQP